MTSRALQACHTVNRNGSAISLTMLGGLAGVGLGDSQQVCPDGKVVVRARGLAELARSPIVSQSGGQEITYARPAAQPLATVPNIMQMTEPVQSRLSRLHIIAAAKFFSKM